MATYVLIVMGVSGAGKTTVGRKLASALGWEFADADDYHSSSNRQKMEKGIPLQEEDRKPWLAELARLIRTHVQSKMHMVLACSALRRSHRSVLGVDQESVRTLYLKVPADVLKKRLSGRKHHFFNESLLHSQLQTLEEPTDGWVLPGELTPDELIERALRLCGY